MTAVPVHRGQTARQNAQALRARSVAGKNATMVGDPTRFRNELCRPFVDSFLMTRSMLALLLLCGPAAAAGTISGPATVIDGDTIEVHGTRINLYGIDAPETAQSCQTVTGREYRCGREAAQALSAHIGSGVVTCERRENSAAGGIAGLCLAHGEDLSAWMVTRGYALASRQVTAAYTRQEGQAWATRRGLWAGTFEKPADWRQDRRRMEASAGASAAD